MLVDELLMAMFPGDPARNVPSFSTLGLDAGALGNLEIVKDIGQALADMPHLSNADVNEILLALRKSYPEAAQSFTEAALTAYFTAPEVIRSIRGGPDTLFPHAWMLPDIDYELLEPVIERASMRDQNERM